MATLDELTRAFQQFGQAAEQYGITSGIKDATEQVEKINAETATSLSQKYQLQKQVADRLQGRLVGLNASGVQIANAVGAIAPPDITTAQGARQLAASARTPADRMEANKLVQSNMKAAGDQNLAAKQPEMEARAKLEEEARQKDRDLQWKIALLGAGGKAKEAKAGEVSFTTNLAMAGDLIKELKGAVKKNGTWESDWFGDPATAATLKQTPYKLAITYAKIVDPDSVAREGEVAAAQKYLIELGAMKNKKAVLAQIDQMSTTINQYRANRGAAMGKPLAGSPIPTSNQPQTSSGGFPTTWVSQEGRVFNARTKEEADRLKMLGATPK